MGWFGTLVAVNLQTAFMTPPFGATLFYMKGTAPPEVSMGDVYGAMYPFVGLQGPNTWLILQIGTGRATGQVHVRNLDVISQGGLAGASDLTGSVTGLTGPAAAGAAGIVPNPNSNFRFNQCAIQSVSCILLPGEAVPTANPLNDINIGTLFNPNEDEDLLLPIVSDQDY